MTMTGVQSNNSAPAPAGKPDFIKDILAGNVHLTRIPGDRPRYQLLWRKVAGTRFISLTEDQIWTWRQVRKKIWSIWEVLIEDEDMTAKDWPKYLKVLTEHRVADPTPDVTDIDLILDRVKEWFQAWIARTGDDESFSAIDMKRVPMHKGNSIYFKVEALERELHKDDVLRHEVGDLSRARLYEALHHAGAKPGSVYLPREKSNEWCWRVSDAFVAPATAPPDSPTPEDNHECPI